MNQRTPSEQRLEMHHRVKVRRLLKATAEIERLQAEVDDLTAELDAQAERESKRLGVEVPPDAFVLDVLELVEVGADDEWTWLGQTNNKQLPTVRTRTGTPNGGERSVVRLLAEAFGLVDPDWEGILYPTTSPLDVNPWHRERREYPEGKCRGNPARYTWREAS